MKKTIAFLIESELEKAEVVLAAKSMTDTIQKMAETVAKMEAEDLMPLNDPIREFFGPEVANTFGETVANKLRELTQTLSETKNAISDEIARMQGESVAAPADNLEGMDDTALAPEPEEASDEDMAEMGADMDVPAPEAAPEAPRFSDEDLGGDAAGRARKESFAPRKPMLENADRALAREYAGLIREGKTPAIAAKSITETYGIDIPTLVEIMEATKKKDGEDYMGFWISRSGGADTPYVARRDDGCKVRADTMDGVKKLVRAEVKKDK